MTEETHYMQVVSNRDQVVSRTSERQNENVVVSTRMVALSRQLLNPREEILRLFS
jgi:hypothetical protein